MPWRARPSPCWSVGTCATATPRRPRSLRIAPMWRRPCSPTTRSTSRMGGTPIPLAAMASVETVATQARRRDVAPDIFDVLRCGAATLRQPAPLAKRGWGRLVTARRDPSSLRALLRRKAALALPEAAHLAQAVPHMLREDLRVGVEARRPVTALAAFEAPAGPPAAQHRVVDEIRQL